MRRRVFSILAALALCLGLLPGTARAEEGSPESRAASADINMDYDGFVFAQGVPIVIREENGITSVFDAGGNLLSGGTDVTGWAIYGGWFDLTYASVYESSASVTLESGMVDAIFGGCLYGTLKGNTSVELRGGTVNYVYGAGNMSDVQGDAGVTIRGGTVTNMVYGGGNQSALTGTASVTFYGGDVQGALAGGGYQDDCAKTHVKIMGQPDGFLQIHGGSSGGRVGEAWVDFHGKPSDSSSLSINGSGWDDAIDHVIFTVGRDSRPESAFFNAVNPDSTATVGNASFEVYVDGTHFTMMNSSGLNGAGVSGTVTATLYGDASTDQAFSTALNEIDELIVESGSFRLAPPMDLDLLEVGESGTVLLPASGGGMKLKSLSGSGTVLFERRGLDPLTLPVQVNRVDVPSGSRIKVGRTGGGFSDSWADTVVFQGDGITALDSAACFSSRDEGFYLAKTDDGSGVQVKEGTEQKATDIYPTPHFDKPSYQYGETMRITMGLRSEGKDPVPGQTLEVRGGVSGLQTFATAVTDENGEASFTLPVDDNLWASRENGLQAIFQGTEDYKECVYGVSFKDQNDMLSYIVTGARADLEGEIAAPARGAAPVRTLAVGGTGICTAQVEWSPADAAFRPEAAYRASIRLVPEPGFRLDGGKLAKVTYQGRELTLPAALEADGSLLFPDIAVFDPIPIVRVTGVTLDRTALTLAAGESAGLTASVLPENADNRAVTWTSSNPAAARVDGSGQVTAQGPGTAVITVTTADGGFTASCRVTVEDSSVPPSAVRVTGVALDRTALELTVGESARLTASVLPVDAENKAVTWTSSNPAAARVDGSGQVTAQGPGTAVITVTTADGGYTASCTVTVKEAGQPGDGPDAPNPPSGGSGSPGYPPGSSSFTSTTTTRNPDGTTTDTTVDRVTGKVTTVTKAPDGTSVTIVKNKKGKITGAQAVIPGGKELVTLPAAVGKDVWIRFTVKGGGSALVKIPAEGVTPGAVAVTIAPDGMNAVVRKTYLTEGGAVLSVTGGDSVKLVENGRRFTDLPAEGWAADAAAFVSARELFKGTGPETFSPDRTMTRAMLAVVLHNLEGNPAGEGRFSDVAPGAWYEAAVGWAADNGIVDGYGGGLFRPGNPITREQLAVILWRYAGSPVPPDLTLDFTDAGEIGGYALAAVRWAVSEGILSGYGDGRLNPKGTATRIQAAQMLRNFMTR